MRAGTLVALVVPNGQDAYLGRLVQPILVDDERRWSIEWQDGLRDPGYVTWPESWIRRVIE
jgi:hypothetical protein